MSISSILRNFDGDPNIVTIVCDNTLAEITAAGYLVDPVIVASIELVNNGEFQWTDTDLVLISYAPDFLIGFFVRDAVNNTFDALAPSGGLANTLQDGDIFVGNAGNVATGVPLTGDIGITNAGVSSIQPGVIVNADVNAAAAIDFSKLAVLPSADILVGSAGGVATARAVTGDIAISNTGVTSIAAGSIVNADINAAAAIDFSKLATLASGNLIVGSAGGVATSVASSGDVTIIASGATAIGANKVLSSMVSPLLMKYIAVPITSAEFLGMYAAPKALITAGGANTVIVLHRAVLAMTYNSIAYADGGIVAIQYNLTANGAGSAASNTEAAVDFFAAESTSFMFNGVAGDTVGAVPFLTPDSVNKGLYLSNITGAFTTGNSAFVAHLWYSIIPTV